MAEQELAGLIGRPLDRVDGRLKVTGRATYAYEYAAQGAVTYGVIVPASIGKGRVAAVDVRDAQRAPGVLLVVTKDNAPPQTPWGPVDLPDRFARAEPALDTDEVRYFGFPVAFVVAETFEQATAAAALVRVRYAALPGDYDLHAAGPHAENPGRISGGEAADSAIGDFEFAFANAPVKIEAIYTTPYQHQAPMEPHATMAVWEDQMLTVHTSAQLTTSPQEGLARTFNIRKEDVRIITRYVGGGFGSKLPFYVDATLAAIGARMLGRPVKVAMTRPQLFHMTTHRTASEQRLRLGADRDGRLTAYGQDALVECARFDGFVDPVCLAARTLYAAPNRLTRHRLAKLDLPRSDSMRAPGDAIVVDGPSRRSTGSRSRSVDNTVRARTPESGSSQPRHSLASSDRKEGSGEPGWVVRRVTHGELLDQSREVVRTARGREEMPTRHRGGSLARSRGSARAGKCEHCSGASCRTGLPVSASLQAALADGIECSKFCGISNQQQSLHSAVANAERDGVGRAAIDPGDNAELTVEHLETGLYPPAPSP